RCSAQSPLGRGTETCLAWSFLRSVWSRLSAQPIGSPAEMNQLILKCANASRSSGQWKDNDYDVIADGVVVGRIFTHVRARVMGSYISTRKCLRTNMEFVSMTTVVRCPSTGRACSEPTCQERHWCRKMFERGLSHKGLPLKRKFRPRCCAKTRAGAPCIMRVVPGKRRCRFHGGLSTGPRTTEGRAKIAEAQRRRWRAFRAAHGTLSSVTC